MAQTAIRLTTTVLPGRRIEVTAPELSEGDDVEPIVLRSEPRTTQGVWDWMRALAPVDRTPDEWTALERDFMAERDAWER